LTRTVAPLIEAAMPSARSLFRHIGRAATHREPWTGRHRTTLESLRGRIATFARAVKFVRRWLPEDERCADRAPSGAASSRTTRRGDRPS
jgi:hypothetical protein